RDWSSDVCSSDLACAVDVGPRHVHEEVGDGHDTGLAEFPASIPAEPFDLLDIDFGEPAQLRHDEPICGRDVTTCEDTEHLATSNFGSPPPRVIISGCPEEFHVLPL